MRLGPEVSGDRRPIAIFDSGVGGLTVVRALRAALPHESTVYLGDTARVPYGTRSAKTVIRYALNNARTLIDLADPKILVVACNTVSAVALGALSEALHIPVVGVIEPGAAAVAQAPSGDVVVLGTRGTIASGAYRRALKSHAPQRKVIDRACPLFVPLVEEGWIDGDVSLAVAHAYLDDVPPTVGVAILGCTHYPLLRSVIERCLGGAVFVVDSARATAQAVATRLGDAGAAPGGGPVTHRILVTDEVQRIDALLPQFLGPDVSPGPVELVDVVVTPPAGGQHG